MFIPIRMRLYCSSVQAMLNQSAVNDSKGESFLLYFYLRDITYSRSRNKPKKIWLARAFIEVSYGSTDRQRAAALHKRLMTCCFAVLYSCRIYFFLCTEMEQTRAIEDERV